MQDYMTAQIADQKGLAITTTYRDEALSGASQKRQGFNDLIKHVHQLAGKEVKILVYDLARIGRDPTIGEEFIQLCWKNEVVVIDRTGTEHTFDTWEKRLFGRIMFAFNTGDREKKNGDTFNGMKTAVQEGRWIISRPKGYHYLETNVGGKKVKVLHPHPTEAGPVKYVREQYANGLMSQEDIFKYLKENNTPICKAKIRKFLENKIYAGLVEFKPWGISLRQGIHQPLHSLEIQDQIEARLKGKPKRLINSSLADDFPFRRYIVCSECGNLLTGCWVKGKSKYYKSYFCQTKGCPCKRKHINGDKIEKSFLELLDSVKLPSFVLEMAREIFQTEWDRRMETMESKRKEALDDLDKIEREIEKLLKRIRDCNSQLVIRSFEQEIEGLSDKKVKIGQHLKDLGDTQVIDLTIYRTLVNRALIFLEKPHQIWEYGSLEIRRVLFEILFDGNIAIHPFENYLTPSFSLFYATINDLEKKVLVGAVESIQYLTLFDWLLSARPKLESVEAGVWQRLFGRLEMLSV